MKPSAIWKAALATAALLLFTLQAVAIEPPSGISISSTAAEFYPIGWSRDGKFAYALVDEPAFRGGYGFLFAIVDARSDKVLWSDYVHSDAFEWHGEGAPVSIAWQRNVPRISEQLAAFGIEQVAEARLDPLPLRQGADEFTAVVSEWRANPATSPYGNSVVGYTLTFQSAERGSKVIARRGRIFATDVRVQGYIQSPFGDRVALLVTESGNAYGASRFTDFTVIGASLDTGFE